MSVIKGLDYSFDVGLSIYNENEKTNKKNTNKKMRIGKKDFSLDAAYIQSQDEASELMKWIVTKISKPRKALGVKIFSIPTIQLGDIVSLDYVENGINIAANSSNRFVVYNIDFSRSSDGPEMQLFLSEVI